MTHLIVSADSELANIINQLLLYAKSDVETIFEKACNADDTYIASLLHILYPSETMAISEPVFNIICGNPINDNIETVNFLLKINPSIVIHDGFIEACCACKLNLAKYLVNVDPTIVGNRFQLYTALHSVSSHSHKYSPQTVKDIIKWLVELSPNYVNSIELDEYATLYGLYMPPVIFELLKELNV